MTDKEKLNFLKDNLRKCCVNRFPVRNSDNERIYYSRDDLWQWSVEAEKRGEDCFYAEPVDPLKPYGALKLCEPKYDYFFNMALTENMYNMIFGDDDTVE